MGFAPHMITDAHSLRAKQQNNFDCEEITRIYI